ncbi:MAG: tetratricopeptide repeat protein, partial [Bryobacter sp.]|nr:tetratricopeptide repeat protein [Bryobacter sp.]
PAEDSLQRARAAAQTAWKLDDTLAEALVATGFVEGYYNWKWDEADRDVRRALDINPSLAIGHYHLSWFYDLFGRMKEAIEEHKRAQELDPFNPMHTGWLAALYREDRRYEEALAEIQKAMKMPGGAIVGLFILGLVYQDQGKHEEAIATLQKAADVDPMWKWAIGSAYVAAGRKDEALKVLNELKAQKVIPWTALWLAELNAALGNLDEAFRWVEYPHQHAWIPWMRTGFLTGLKALRQDPRFNAQLRRMNLPPVTS